MSEAHGDGGSLVGALLSLFSVLKPFEGEIDRIQRNALRSWSAIPGIEVLALGTGSGVAEAAHEVGAAYEPRFARTPGGAPSLPDVFERAERWASSDSLLYVNGDILLPPTLGDVIRVVRTKLPHALGVGQCRNVDVSENLRGWSEEIAREGRLRGPGGIDYVAFERGAFPALPMFALGRAYFDNWLLWDARKRGVPVVDLTQVVLAVHQNHRYGHLVGGKNEAYDGDDARRNYALAGGQLHLFNIDDASHRLTVGGLRPNRVAPFRTFPPFRWVALRMGELERWLRRPSLPKSARTGP
ncbi:MAG: hypothetical protein ACXVRS_03310 [Gaiellaceae bacterium]